MSNHRTHRVISTVAAAAVAAVLAASCSSTVASTDDSDTTVGTMADVAALLGPANRATGSPVTIGLVDDGKAVGIDHTTLVAAFNATVQYANEHLGGLNGHVIQVDECATNNTPTDATNCGVKLADDGVAAVLVPVSAQDGNVFTALASSGIPYVTYNAGAQDIMVKPGAFLLVDPIGLLAGPAKLAKDAGVKKAGIILIDVPASTGPVTAIAKPMYAKAGVDVDVVAISPQTADQTPQIQQAISNGADMFTIIGTDEFNASAIKNLKQLGFAGRIVMVTAPSKEIADSVPGGLEGISYITSNTGDPHDPDVQRYEAVMRTYMGEVVPSSVAPWAYATVMGFVNALSGTRAAVDAPSILRALGSMPAALPVPLGGGLTFQCGAKVVPIVPNVCTANVLSTTLDEQGRGGTYSILDVTDYLTLGS